MPALDLYHQPVRKIAVEIKTFVGPSKISDLEDAVGQCVVYLFDLRQAFPLLKFVDKNKNKTYLSR